MHWMVILKKKTLLFWNRKCEEKKTIILYSYDKEMKHGLDK